MYDISKEFNEQTPGNFLIFSRFFFQFFFRLNFKRNPQSHKIIWYYTTPELDQGLYEYDLVS